MPRHNRCAPPTYTQRPEPWMFDPKYAIHPRSIIGQRYLTMLQSGLLSRTPGHQANINQSASSRHQGSSNRLPSVGNGGNGRFEGDFVFQNGPMQNPTRNTSGSEQRSGRSRSESRRPRPSRRPSRSQGFVPAVPPVPSMSRDPHKSPTHRSPRSPALSPRSPPPVASTPKPPPIPTVNVQPPTVRAGNGNNAGVRQAPKTVINDSGRPKKGVGREEMRHHKPSGQTARGGEPVRGQKGTDSFPKTMRD